MADFQNQKSDTPKTALEEIDARYFRKRQRQLLAEKVALTLGTLSVVTVIVCASYLAERHYAQEALINQERIHVARR